MKTKSFLIVALLGLIFSFLGCKKVEMVEPTNPSLEDLYISESFDWKTTQQITLHLTGYASNIAHVASSNGTVYHTVFLNQKERMTVMVTIPTYENSIQLLYMGQVIDLPVASSEIEYIFN